MLVALAPQIAGWGNIWTLIPLVRLACHSGWSSDGAPLAASYLGGAADGAPG